MYADHVARCPLINHGEYTDGTDRWTTNRRMPDHYITLAPDADSVAIRLMALYPG